MLRESAPRPARRGLPGVSTALLALFAVGAAVLTSVVPALWIVAQRAGRARQAAVTDATGALLANTAHGDRAVAQRTLDGLRLRYGIDAIEVQRPGEPPLRSGDPAAMKETSRSVSRFIGPIMLRTWFTEADLVDVSRTVRFAMLAGALAATAGLILLPIYIIEGLRRASAPHPAPVDGTQGGTAYLLQTFESSLGSLKQRETELKRLHLQQKERADELARLTGTLVRSLTSGFIALDEHGRVVEVNQAARELLHLSPNPAILGRGVSEALGASSFARTLALAHQRRAAVQRREVSSGGAEPAIIGVSTVPLLDEHGRYLGMLALFADLTEVRKLEQRVRDMQALADLGEMSAGIAHEFRNSLATILGYIRLAGRGVSDPNTEERLRKAEQESVGLSEAVERLLAFGRPLTPRLEPVEVTELARDVVTRLAPLAESIEFRVAGDALRIDGDAALLARAIENIVRNAVDSINARDGGGRVTITTFSHPIRRLTIEDDGAGLDPSVRLFVPFQSGKPSGFGLGLTLAKKIILLHGGAIRLLPRPEGGAIADIEFHEDAADADPLSEDAAAALN